MSYRVRLVLAIHIHQPVDNFQDVFEHVYKDSYEPFLGILKDFPEISISLHISGSLLEWIVQAHPEYIDQVRELVKRNQVEIIGGAFYEPILSCVPRRDRIGQITAFSGYLEEVFGCQVRGMWIPERVWEQSFASDIAQSGIEYTLLDDFHFHSAGLRDDDLVGYYLTEDDGHLLKVFPGSEQLRYNIPYGEPSKTIDYLLQIAEKRPNAVVAFGDDGEKFGSWPGTSKHVYADGWLRRFLETLCKNSDWLKVATMAEVVDQVPPIGKCYLPDASYREMAEWALPTQRLIEYGALTKRGHETADWGELQPFMRGGFWRNFRMKYPESNEMYSRMIQVSGRLDRLAHGMATSENDDRLNKARTELYRAQCNCSYWHGVFGGLYLPHLRNGVYSHLIAADSILDSVAGRSGRWVQIDADDYDLDARKEIRMMGNRLVAFLAPSRGGHLYELDIRSIRHNLVATLDRRPEAYHEQVRRGGRHGHGDQDGAAASIHELVQFKEPDLDKKLLYDSWPRKCLVDHFLQPDLSFEDFQAGDGEIGDFASGVFESVLRRSDDRVEARMSREGRLGSRDVTLSKTVVLDAANGSSLSINYELQNLPPGVPIHFGVEFNFSGLAAGASDRYFYDVSGRQLGQLESIQSLTDAERIGLMDEWLGLDVSLELSHPASIWTFPIQTISQSEDGFELVHQSCAVVPHWQFTSPRDGRWNAQLTLSIDTSAAQARQLRDVNTTSVQGPSLVSSP